MICRILMSSVLAVSLVNGCCSLAWPQTIRLEHVRTWEFVVVGDTASGKLISEKWQTFGAPTPPNDNALRKLSYDSWQNVEDPERNETRKKLGGVYRVFRMQIENGTITSVAAAREGISKTVRFMLSRKQQSAWSRWQSPVVAELRRMHPDGSDVKAYAKSLEQVSLGLTEGLAIDWASLIELIIKILKLLGIIPGGSVVDQVSYTAIVAPSPRPFAAAKRKAMRMARSR